MTQETEIPIKEIGKLQMDIAEHLQEFSYMQRSLPYCLDYAELLIKHIAKSLKEGKIL